MKRIYLLGMFTLLSMIFTFSCSSGGDNPIPKPEKPETTEIKLEVQGGKMEIKKGETLSFVVKNQDGTTLTKEVSLFIDGTKTEGMSHQFSKVGEYSIYAKYKGLTSSTIKVKVVISAITLEIVEGQTKIEKSTTLSFAVKDDANNKLTENVSIFINKKKIEGFSYTFDKEGEYTIYAEYNGMKSAEIKVTVSTAVIALEIVENKTEIKRGTTLSFVVKDGNKNKLTENVSIFINKKKIEGFSYKFDTVGEYSIYAEYKELKSAEISVTVMPAAVTLEVVGGKTEIEKGTSVSFMVKDDANNKLTEDVSLFVNQEKIEGFSHIFDKVGEYAVYAEYKGLKSAEIKIKVLVSAITIEVDGGKTDIKEGASLSFTVKDDDSNKLTEDVSLFINDNKIDGFSYKFAQVGQYTVYAKYKELKSQNLTINVTERTNMSHTKKVLLEDYTGAWCGWCPGMIAFMNDAHKKYPNAIPVALHVNDAMHFKNVRTLMNKFGVNGLPTMKLNRTKTCEFMNQIKTALEEEVNLGLAIASSLNNNSLNVTVKVHYTSKSQGKNKLVVYLLENGLVYDQNNYYNTDTESPYYGKGNPIKDFVHNHVARKALTNVLGDDIPDEKNAEDETYEKEFNITLPSSIQNQSKLDIVAFVVDDAKNVINVQHAKVGEDKDFD